MHPITKAQIKEIHLKCGGDLNKIRRAINDKMKLGTRPAHDVACEHLSLYTKQQHACRDRGDGHGRSERGRHRS